MVVNVEYHAQLRQAVGRNSETLSLPEGSTIAQAMSALIEQSDGPVKAFLCTVDGRLHPSILLAVGETIVSHTDTHPLTDGQTLAILSPVAGG